MQALSRCERATLALADGKVFHGISVGKRGETSGEVVFNTSMSGYQEILTDPSYVNQLLTFTCPHIGNVGTNDEDVESGKVQAAGLIVKEFSRHYSNFRAERSLEDYLEREGIVGIAGIDTRELVLYLREHGAMMGVIASGDVNADELVDKARALPSMEGLDLVKGVTTSKSYDWYQGIWQPGRGFAEYSEEQLRDRPLVVALDFGIKYNILRLLVHHGFRVRVVPADMPSQEILAMRPDAIFLSNGPGDPAAVSYGIESTRALLGKKPIFGICLGHQILGLALGAPTFKLKFGHRGGNHPVLEEKTGSVNITVQNHGFATKLESVPEGIEVTYINLNDHTVEGLEVPDARAFSVQYHPEASPGPKDAVHLFQRFRELFERNSV